MEKKTIWITGSEGKLGGALIRTLQKMEKYYVVGTDMDVDITSMEAVMAAARSIEPNIVINCAAISDSDYCEEHMLDAYRVNAIGARNMATVARQREAKIIHISTDDVFEDGSLEPKTEFDTPSPKSVYGKSKLAGENYVKELNPRHVIIRSSWIYGMGKEDYFTYVVEHGKKEEAFSAPLDKLSTPTPVTELVRFILLMLESKEYGTFHCACTGACSRQDFAKAILQYMGYGRYLANGVFSNQNNMVTSTVLENLMMELTGIYQMPSWEQALEEYAVAYREAD